jgi:hypothetical protein
MSEEQKLNINFPPNLQEGAYANNMVVGHTREEFIMDFMLVAAPAGVVTARVICSPGHMKRIINALQDNLHKYEEQFGKIPAAEEPKAESDSEAMRL